MRIVIHEFGALGWTKISRQLGVGVSNGASCCSNGLLEWSKKMFGKDKLVRLLVLASIRFRSNLDTKKSCRLCCPRESHNGSSLLRQALMTRKSCRLTLANLPPYAGGAEVELKTREGLSNLKTQIFCCRSMTFHGSSSFAWASSFANFTLIFSSNLATAWRIASSTTGI
jgi:hypothetical protein